MQNFLKVNSMNNDKWVYCIKLKRVDVLPMSVNVSQSLLRYSFFM